MERMGGPIYETQTHVIEAAQIPSFLPGVRVMQSQVSDLEAEISTVEKAAVRLAVVPNNLSYENDRGRSWFLKWYQFLFLPRLDSC